MRAEDGTSIGVNPESEEVILMMVIPSILRHEGFRSWVYSCPNGYPTVGHGVRLTTLKHLGLAVDGRLSVDVSEALVRVLVLRIVRIVLRRYRWLHAQPIAVSAVVVEMIYQMGMAGFLGFKKTIAALKAGNYQLAAAEMLNSRWARILCM